MNVRVAFEELFCTPKSSMENPSLRTSRYSDPLSRFRSLYRTFIVVDDSEEEFGHCATDEMTGEQGYVDDENLCFWRWDDSRSTWKTRPFRSRH